MRETGLRLGLYAGFAATGVSLSLPGALLPLLLRRWQMGDASGGLLLFCFFLATMAGAIATRGRLNRSIARGALFTAAGALWLALSGPRSGFAAMAVFGLGLGIAMTSTSLFVSQRFPAGRRVEMMRLNLLWAAGACAGPWLALGGRALHHASSTARPLHVLAGIAVLFGAFALWSLLALPTNLRVQPSPARQTNADATAAVPLVLLILVFCSTGVEAAVGGWLATFAQRLGEGAGTTIGAATAFWVGLLSSRLLHSIRAAERASERLVLPVSVGLITVGLALLIGWASGAASVLAAFLAGFGVGPVYPLLLAMVLRRRESTGVFVLAGVGSATIPLATGALSHWAGSLAAGLCVPLATAAMMTVLSLYRRADLRVPSLRPSSAD